MKRLSLIFFLIPALSLFSQNLDSLFNDFLRIEGLPHYVKGQVVTSVAAPIKCGFGTISDVKLNFNNFKPEQQKFIASVLQRPATDTSFITQSGKFRIHFFKKGNDAPLFDLFELAKAADSSYNFEVNIMGFPPPPKDGNAGGDDKYDIYIQNLAGGLYGYTETDQQITDSTYTAFTVIDNDFGTGYYTHGIDAARVTIAHEFHHAIQVGNYIFRMTDQFYYELTSTSMEEFVYDSINDYYNYLGYYFSSPNKAFSSNDGYDLAIWNIFLKDRFGFGIIKRAWELMPAERALQAVAGSIQDAGSNFKIEFNTFGLWTYFTGSRSVTGKYFKEASSYPL
ncbi:MAG: MXAN_6640 family putative metalloprotease, partial [Bacteroidota bacterium]